MMTASDWKAAHISHDMVFVVMMVVGTGGIGGDGTGEVGVGDGCATNLVAWSLQRAGSSSGPRRPGSSKRARARAAAARAAAAGAAAAAAAAPWMAHLGP